MAMVECLNEQKGYKYLRLTGSEFLKLGMLNEKVQLDELI